MNRRAFLGQTGKVMAGLGTAPLLPRLFASTASAQGTSPAQGAGNYKAIVCLMLSGGNDGNNTLVPADGAYKEYAAGRGGLVLSKASLRLQKPTSSGRVFGAHPALQNVAALYNSGQAAWIANAGPLSKPTTKQAFLGGQAAAQDLFSHTSQLSEWESASSLTGSRTGWAGRTADLLLSRSPGSSLAPTVISTAGWSLMGAGATTNAASIGTGDNQVTVLNALQAMLPVVSELERGDPNNHLHDAVSSMQSEILKTTALLGNAYKAGSGLKTTFPSSSIAQQLQSIAYLINARSMMESKTQIFFCSDDGYDLHSDQLAAHNTKLGGVDAAVGSFVAAMQEIGMFDQVTLFTMSDFARSHQGNSSRGSDHAWGNHHFVIGGAVRGGDVYGTFPSLVLGGDDDANTNGVWIPTTSASQYAATLTKWLGVAPGDNLALFPELGNFTQTALGFM